MTDLNKPVKRRTNALAERKRLIATLYPNGLLGLRLERSRHEEVIPLEWCYYSAVKVRVGKERAERLQKRKSRR